MEMSGPVFCCYAALAARSSLLIRASQVVRRSKLAFQASISTRLREYDNILCPSLCSNDLSSQAPHKSSPFTWKLQDDLWIGPRPRFVLIRKVTWRGVTSEKCEVTKNRTTYSGFPRTFRVYLLKNSISYEISIWKPQQARWTLFLKDDKMHGTTFTLDTRRNEQKISQAL